MDYFQLDETVGAAVVDVADAVRRDLTHVLEEGDAPREDYYEDEGPMATHATLLQAQMAVPGEGHEDVRQNEEKNGVYAFHLFGFLIGWVG